MILIQTVGSVANEEQSALGSCSHSERCLSEKKTRGKGTLTWRSGERRLLQTAQLGQQLPAPFLPTVLDILFVFKFESASSASPSHFPNMFSPTKPHHRAVDHHTFPLKYPLSLPPSAPHLHLFSDFGSLHHCSHTVCSETCYTPFNDTCPQTVNCHVFITETASFQLPV